MIVFKKLNAYEHIEYFDKSINQFVERKDQNKYIGRVISDNADSDLVVMETVGMLKKYKKRKGVKRSTPQVALKNKLKYIEDEYKTKGGLITSINTTVSYALDEMMLVKKFFNKMGGIPFHHFVVSFPSNMCITSEEALSFTANLLKKFSLFKDFQMVLACHLDTSNIHVHIVVNSVNKVNGKKFHISREETQEILSYLKDVEYKRAS